MEQEFSVLENKAVGRNMYINRKIRDKKAQEVADYLGISESAYTKYERGESKITVDIIQRVAEFHKVDPVSLLSSQGITFIDSGNNSPNSSGANGGYYNNVQSMTDEQTKMMLTLIQSVTSLNEKLIAVLDKLK
ncbi:MULTISPECIES: helix-turn-helix domain-containing protein [Chitinophagaceae]|jgi:transcriptional regulator with XRE-family HTH domain|uniref:Helix-turn-helix protein n=1 Tax=Pseudobacter ginsenosidimutans TaxID=661488 RepID=A0A4V2F1X3_9BACT|nr:MULTISPECIES: helix-turn-helix transcriptional regulator [Chitinophagaceae]QEC43852.1 helix-turn-helix transcriptional regulator [Pseudobacter ginsenosidimutans]RZS75276.1 helix-turn-helix protein [Pseudobacter ginsenosidimutans]